MNLWYEQSLTGPNTQKIYTFYDVEHRVPLNEIVRVKEYKESRPISVEKDYAPQYGLMNPNTKRFVNMICVDVDSEEYWENLHWSNYPEENAMCLNPKKKSFHVFYRLKDPVYISGNRSAAEKKLELTVKGLDRTLWGDKAYNHQFAKNPYSGEHEVYLCGDPTLTYTLDELLDHVPDKILDEILEEHQKRYLKNDVENEYFPIQGERHKWLFDEARKTLYQDWIRFSHLQKEHLWIEHCLEVTQQIHDSELENTPLPYSEIKGIAYDINKFIQKIFTTKSQYVKRTHTSEIQRERGQRGGAKSGEVRGQSAKEKQALVLLYRQEYPDASIRDIVEATGFSKSAIQRYLKG